MLYYNILLHIYIQMKNNKTKKGTKLQNLNKNFVTFVPLKHFLEC